MMKLLVLTFLGLLFHVANATVLVNEIMRNPTLAEDDRGEWFELYNSGSTPVNIFRWTFRDGGRDNFRIRSNLIIPAGGYVVLANGNNTNTNGNLRPVDYVYSSRKMSFRRRDSLVVLNSNNRRVDRVNWGVGSSFPSQAGASIALKAVNLNNNNGRNWCLSTTPYGRGDFGTPGEANDCPGTTRPPVNKAPVVAPSAPKAPAAPIVAPAAPKAAPVVVPAPAPAVAPIPAPVVVPVSAPVVAPVPAPVVVPIPAPAVAPVPAPVVAPMAASAPVPAPVVAPIPAPVAAAPVAAAPMAAAPSAPVAAAPSAPVAAAPSAPVAPSAPKAPTAPTVAAPSA